MCSIIYYSDVKVSTIFFILSIQVNVLHTFSSVEVINMIFLIVYIPDPVFCGILEV